MMDEPKKYTDKQLLFLDALMGEAGGNIRKAMDIAGYAKTTKSGEVVKNLREEVIERASLMLAMNAPKAAFGIIGVLDDPSAMGARNSISAAREILDRTGLVKKEQVEVTSQGGGMFILPPKSSDDMG
tara:strand:- start:4373 stop:4756 length:384 start_codon:yes stop_codon:yes gene_type:complete